MRNFFKTVLVSGLILLSSFSSSAFASYDKPYIGETQTYIARQEDTMVHIARDNVLGFIEMRAANPEVDPWLPGAGTKLILPKRHILPNAPHEGIVINLPEMRLYAFINGDEAPLTFPIGVGREGLDTPLGETKVVRKQEGPIWRPTPRMREENPKLPEVVGPGPENPLGDYALYLGWPQYAIHGTNRPFGIGRRVSSGCIRMYPESIEQLFQVVPVGTKVRVVNQPIKLAWIGDELFLEAHPDLEQAFQMEETGEVYEHKLTNDDLKTILKAAGDYKDSVDWTLVRQEIKARRGYPVVIAQRGSKKVHAAIAEPVRQGELKAEREPDKTVAYEADSKRTLNP